MPDLSKKDMDAIVSRITASVLRELKRYSSETGDDLRDVVDTESAWKITYDTSGDAIRSLKGIAEIGDQAWKITYDTSGDALDHLQKIADISDMAWKITYDTSDSSVSERLREVEDQGLQAWKVTYDTSC